MAASGARGTNTKEYRTIKRHRDIITDNLGSTVGDPARFAGRLREKSLISDGECLCTDGVGSSRNCVHVYTNIVFPLFFNY